MSNNSVDIEKNSIDTLNDGEINEVDEFENRLLEYKEKLLHYEAIVSQMKLMFK